MVLLEGKSNSERESYRGLKHVTLVVERERERQERERQKERERERNRKRDRGSREIER